MQAMPQTMPQGNPADAGRGADNVLAHLSLGEVVIPRAFLDDPQVMQVLQQIFQAGGADINEFTVGHEANKINPETGYPEFFSFKKLFRKVSPFIAPALSIFAPGIGTALGSALLGAGAAGASTLGSALIGAGTSALGGGGLKGAATGAALGGIGANIGNIGSAASPGSGILGAAGRNIPGLYDVASGISGLGESISGLSGGQLSADRTAIESAMGIKPVAPGAGGLTGSVGGGSSLSNLSTIGNAIGGLQQDAALKKQKEQLLAAQNQQLGNLENLNPVDVQNDPGYQFNLEQGQQGLNRTLGAQGNLFSGAALKAASQYNQDFAQNYYNQAYGRQAQKVGAQNDIYGNRGNILGNATLGRSNNINQTLANLVGGNVGGYSGQGTLTNEQLMALMRERGLA